MAASIPTGPWSQSLGNVLGRLRDKGQSTLMAALGPAPEAPKPELPGLQGEALARHHIGLAIAALRKPGSSKPELFRQLRLLINKFEQSTGRPELTSPEPTARPALPAMSRRTRLLSKAFEGANALARWRATSQKDPSEMRAA